ncbi:MAG: multiheme c-type cytochrome [Desulfobulbus sp.]|nr:multiheme c-type cytochrome [Desulfobulbus sp.]
MSWTCFFRLRLLGYLFISGTAFVAGCNSFDHLTKVPPVGEPGPKAIECGACHVQQYQEWQATAHARSYTNAAFKDAAGNPPEEECLQCHSPLSVHGQEVQARSFNREEGVVCISCHLVDGTMHGPHPSTALVSPHPIVEDPITYASPDFCAPCHGETHEQWQKATASQPRPTCQECHQTGVRRTASQGTNLLSNILVSFEKTLPSHSHDIRLEKMASFPEMVEVTMMIISSAPAQSILEITVLNNLPHDLPTGTYGSKEIRLLLVADKEGRSVNGQGIVLSNAAQALASGAKKTIEISIPRAYRARPLNLHLVRISPNDPVRKPLILASFPIPSAQEAKP